MAPERISGSDGRQPRRHLLPGVRAVRVPDRPLAVQGRDVPGHVRARQRAVPRCRRPRCPTLPRRLDDVIRKGMAKDPDERYQTANQFSAAARAALSDAGVTPPLPGSAPRMPPPPPSCPPGPARPAAAVRAAVRRRARRPAPWVPGRSRTAGWPSRTGRSARSRGPLRRASGGCGLRRTARTGRASRTCRAAHRRAVHPAARSPNRPPSGPVGGPPQGPPQPVPPSGPPVGAPAHRTHVRPGSRLTSRSDVGSGRDPEPAAVRVRSRPARRPDPSPRAPQSRPASGPIAAAGAAGAAAAVTGGSGGAAGPPPPPRGPVSGPLPSGGPTPSGPGWGTPSGPTRVGRARPPARHPACPAPRSAHLPRRRPAADSARAAAGSSPSGAT